jgi:host factor-I protein
MPFHGQGMPPRPPQKGRIPPSSETSQEASYLKTLGEKQRVVNIKLVDGETVQGWIEYYDRDMVRLTREGQPNLFIFKHEILYIEEEGGKRPKP